MDINTEYDPDRPTELCKIMDNNGSDKGSEPILDGITIQRFIMDYFLMFANRI